MTEITGTNGRPTVQVIDKADVGISGLKAEDFLNMLVVQLQNQDPTEPTDNEQILTQVSQLRDLQASSDLSDALQQMVSGSELANAAGLIGGRIIGRNANGDQVDGIATSARLVNGSAVLKVNGEDISVSDIDSVSTPESLVQEAA